ncbi:hypothetical protein IWW38_004341 [Coemansia aciculifera]|uniref:Uncharacterized protein n=1 Tax=Coemansia aciculifera TaxID=417176 RepID=A0ACC1LZR5_9FUNG|nr:hypothetical protein IWW38_004341 [Coemansia aciculifera]
MATFRATGPLIWVFVAVASYFVVENIRQTIQMLGLGHTYSSVNTTSCTLSGCEDIVVDPETGLAYMACGKLPARQHWLHPDDEYDLAHEKEADVVYVMDENDSYSEIRALERSSDGSLQPFTQDFRVHGFDIYWSPSAREEMTLMFVNHQLGQNAVSIFSHTRGDDYMVHEETVASDLLNSPNNILAMSRRAFYATNDMKYISGVRREVSQYLRLSSAHVVYRSEQGKFSIAAKGIKYANGIARYKDWIYVAASSYPGVHIYKARPDHSLALLGSVDFKDSTPDNIFIDPLTGQLYCASFLRALEVFRYFKHPSLNTTTTASTKIVRLTQRKDLSNGGFDIESILIDSGRLMPTATIAAIQRRNNVKRLLVGCVMCDAVVACDDANLIE